VLNVWLLHFAEMIGATWFSVALHESYYAYAWIESLHVITLTISYSAPAPSWSACSTASSAASAGRA